MDELTSPITRELGSTRMKIREDLVFTPQLGSGQAHYLVEDPLRSRFFRLGLAEYTFVSLLDGKSTTEAVVHRLANVLPDHRLNEVDITGLCRWLVDMDLVTGELETQAERTRLRDDKPSSHPAVKLLFFRWSLFHPDRALGHCATWCGWMFSPYAAVLWFVLLLSGAWSVVSRWNHFVASSQGIFTSSAWLWLVASWLVLKVFHEAAHGIVCKRYGGTVREAGFLFVLLTPLAYVDVTSSWRFRSHWQRAHVAAAGMYMELALAAIAAIVWPYEGSDWLNHLCFKIIVMASLTTVLLNANPLMKFDGYYLLSDLLKLPNLATNSQLYLRHWVRRWLLEVPSRLPDWSTRERRAIVAYAWSSLAWRIVVSVSLLISASALFQGAGVVLAILAGGAWFGLPAWKFVRYLAHGQSGEQPNRTRFVTYVASICGACVLVFGLVPWPGARHAPAVVEYAPHAVIRASSSGFVRDVCITGGQQVAAGEMLLVLENHDLVREEKDLTLQIQQSEIRANRHELQGERAAQQAELKNRAALMSQLAEKREQVLALKICAPAAGTVVMRNPKSLLGTYLKQGDAILSLGNESCKELRISVSQQDVDAYTRHVSKPVTIDFPQQPLWSAELLQIIPRAVLEPPHAGMATVNGGTLPVKSAETNSKSDQRQFEFFTPRFTGRIALTPRDSVRLHSGQIGHVACRDFEESIGERLYFLIRDWVRAQVEASQS